MQADRVCRCVHGRTSSRNISSEERGTVKSLPAVLLGKRIHTTLAAGEMLGGQGSCSTASLWAGNREAGPAHRAKVPLCFGLSDCQESYALTGAGVPPRCLHKYWRLSPLSSESCLSSMRIPASLTPGLGMPGLPRQSDLALCL